MTACSDGLVIDLDNRTIDNLTITEQVAPYVTAFYPAIHIANINANAFLIPITIDNITVTFSESMDPDTITTNTADTSCSGSFQLSKCGNGGSNCNNAFLSSNTQPCVPMTATTPVASNDNKTFTIDTSVTLAQKLFYKIKVTTGAKDRSANALNRGSSDNESTFETVE